MAEHTKRFIYNYISYYFTINILVHLLGQFVHKQGTSFNFRAICLSCAKIFFIYSFVCNTWVLSSEMQSRLCVQCCKKKSLSYMTYNTAKKKFKEWQSLNRSTFGSTTLIIHTIHTCIHTSCLYFQMGQAQHTKRSIDKTMTFTFRGHFQHIFLGFELVGIILTGCQPVA